MPHPIAVNPTGDPGLPYAIVGEAPGPTEDRDQRNCDNGRGCLGDCEGHVFSGASGQTLDVWLEKVGLPRSQWHVRNVVRHWPHFWDQRKRRYETRKPSDAEVEADLPLLHQWWDSAQPKLIVAMGAYAIDALLDGTEYADKGIYKLNGRPCQVRDTVVIPTLHVAAGLRSPSIAVQTYLALKAAAKFIGEGHTVDSWFGDGAPTQWRVLHGASEVEAVFATEPREFGGTVVDTEGPSHRPWMLQFSLRRGQSYIIEATDRAALAAFYRVSPRPFIFHNVLYDLDAMDALGITLRDDEYACSLVKTYVCAKEWVKDDAGSDEATVFGQGLKNLSYKYHGHRMTTYPELIRPAQDAIARAHGFKAWEQTLGPERPTIVNINEDYVDLGDGNNFIVAEKAPNPYPIVRGNKKAGIKSRTRLQSRKAYRELVAPTVDIADLAGRQLVCICASSVDCTCYADILADRVADSPGVLNPPIVGREHSLKRRLSSLLVGKDPHAKWKALMKAKPEWKALVDEAIGPLRKLKREDIDADALGQYAAEDPDYTGRVNIHCGKEMDRLALWSPYRIDMAVIPMLRAMEKTGLGLDLGRLRALEADVQREAAREARALRRFAWDHGMPDFDPNSGDSVAEFLYKRCRVTPVEFTKGGARPSVAEKALASLDLTPDLEEFRSHLLEYRGLSKLDSTFIRPLPAMAARHDDGKIHVQWRHTVTVSGRLACGKKNESPNLLAFPSPDRDPKDVPEWKKWGRRIRGCFVAGQGKVFLSIDLAQIEIRVAASLSQDPVMLRAIREGRDMHADTAVEAFGLTPEQAKANYDGKRTASKILNFSCLYFIEAEGYQKRLAMMGVHLPIKACAAALAAKREEWKVCFAYLNACADACASHPDACAYDMWGRMRHLPLVWSPVSWAREEARRQAGNLAIQGGALGVEKIGMAKWWREVKPLLPHWSPTLMIHDDCEFEGPEDEVEYAAKLTIACFEEAAQEKFIVPIIADGKAGGSWGELEKLKKAA